MRISEQLAGAWRRGRLVILPALLVTLLALNQLYLVTARDHRANSLVVQTADLVYVPDTRMMRALMLGYDQAAADIMWIRTLEYFARHLLSDKEYRWLEHFLDQILVLDPRFRKVYHWAGANVLYGRRFTNENVALSNRFYEKALERFPDDHEAAYRIGLNYYIEMRSDDPAEAARFRELGLSYLERAANTPDAPPRLRSLVASISSKLGKKQVALQYLLDLYIASEDPQQKAALKARIDQIEAEVGSDVYTEAAEAFQAGWKARFPYVPPALYVLMGEPAQPGQRDRDWRSLLPDVEVDALEDAAAQDLR